MKKITIKKAQSGVKVDKTSVRKTNASSQMKRDNDMTTRNFRNRAKYYKNESDLDVSTAMQYPSAARTMMDAARRDDSLSNEASKKARESKANPKFPNKKSGGKITKKKK